LFSPKRPHFKKNQQDSKNECIMCILTIIVCFPKKSQKNTWERKMKWSMPIDFICWTISKGQYHPLNYRAQLDFSWCLNFFVISIGCMFVAIVPQWCYNIIADAYTTSCWRYSKYVVTWDPLIQMLYYGSPYL